jgi:RHS repeat-associated protein
MTGLTTSNNAVSSFNGTNTWTYDSKDRLTGDALTGGAAYSLTNAYDSAGNPTTYRNVASQTFNADNQKTASGTFVYDGNGNPTTYAGGTLTFDPMDKMTSITSSGTGSYRYRADGLRAWKGWNVTIPTTSGIPVTGATYFLYDGGNPVVEMDSSGAVTAVNVFAHDGLVARVEGSTAKYYQIDAQGSVAHRTNSSGAVTSSSKYEAYGKHVNIPGSTVDTYGWNARWGYYYDSETGLYLCQQRYYDSNQGRWLNRDPIGYAGGVNVYGYCGGGPVGGVDATGLNPLLGLIGRIFTDIECEQLAEKIRKALKKVVDRWFDLYNVKHNLFQFGSEPNPGAPNAGTWEGHKEQLEGWQRHLRKLRAKYWDKCGGPDPCGNIMYWADRKAPVRPGVSWEQSESQLDDLVNKGIGHVPLPGLGGVGRVVKLVPIPN